MSPSDPSPSTVPEPATLLRVRDLHVGYPGQAPFVRGWSADIGPGAALLRGDTGSGKSSVMRVLAGDAVPQAGTLALPQAAWPGDAAAWRQQCFYVDPMTEAFHDMAVQACVAQLREGDAHFDAARWQALAEAFGLAPHLDKKMLMLSTGSRRKVWLAAALASGRPLVLLDEPTAALDAPSIRALHAALAEAVDEHHRLVLVASSDEWPDLPWRLDAALPLA